MRDLSVCGALEFEDLHRLNQLASNLRLMPGQAAIMESDPADHLFVLTEGCMKIYKLLADGRRQITGFLFPSDFLGLAMQNQYAYSAEAVTPSMLCRFARDKLEKLLDEFPQLERRLLGIASNELAAAQDQMLLLGRKTASEKLATFLALLERRAVRRGGAPGRAELPMTRADIADYIGLTIETVSRCFTKLRRQGLIDISKPPIVEFLDPAALLELAGLPDEEITAETRAL